MALTALALSATAANAQTDPEVEVEGGQHCSAVTLDQNHGVEGGCHIEYESEEHVLLAAEVAPGVTVPVSNCNVELEARIDENGEGYVTYAELTPEPPPGTDPTCTRQPCDETTHEMLPWPIHINEFGPTEEIAATFCLRGGSHGDETEGGQGANCTVHLPVTPDGHEYEFGDDTSRFHCEEDGMQHIFIEKAHFIDTNTEPSIEILH